MSGASNPLAIIFFFVFISATLGITYWAARRTKTTEHFYAAGGGITGFQNGLALAGDYMSAASFLGIAGLVALSGFDGLIYSIGWLVGWPIVMFLIAEPLRNLGKYTFADVVAFRLRQTPVRIAAAIGTLAVVLILPDRADGRRRQPDQAAVRPRLRRSRSSSSACVMLAYVLFGGMIATTWVQIVKAVLLLGGARRAGADRAVEVRLQPAQPVRAGGDDGCDPTRRRLAAVLLRPKVLAPGTKVVTGPWDAMSLGLALMFGTAGLPHILMRFYTVPERRRRRASR